MALGIGPLCHTVTGRWVQMSWVAQSRKHSAFTRTFTGTFTRARRSTSGQAKHNRQTDCVVADAGYDIHRLGQQPSMFPCCHLDQPVDTMYAPRAVVKINKSVLLFGRKWYRVVYICRLREGGMMQRREWGGRSTVKNCVCVSPES